ncbi:hypothetical protein BDZ89DRAFT_537290 [Hymenopellis radicata]|nr:hypothetical protein BDZ89DRAFT_537290 [Hymenopellis radicata]
MCYGFQRRCFKLRGTLLRRSLSFRVVHLGPFLHGSLANSPRMQHSLSGCRREMQAPNAGSFVKRRASFHIPSLLNAIGRRGAFNVINHADYQITFHLTLAILRHAAYQISPSFSH